MKLLFDCTSSANNLQTGWIKTRIYGRDVFNADRSAGIKELVQKAAIEHTQNSPLFWDIEHWNPFEQYEDRFIEIVEWTREVRSDLRQGFYGLFPVRNYWGPVQKHLKLEPNNYDFWVQQNSRYSKSRDDNGRFNARGLADMVDCICPSIYTFYSNADSPRFPLGDLWKEYAIAMIAEARKYQGPVYPWIMPRYHPDKHPDMEPLGDDVFLSQIETILTYADGIVIFDDKASKIPYDCEPIMQQIATRNSVGEFE